MKNNVASLEEWSKQEYTGIRPGLGGIKKFFAATRLDPAEFPTAHVAGTNGKGSVCAFLASIFRAAGLKTGLYTSPHLVRVGERINLDGKPLSGAALSALFRGYRRPITRAGLTFFEAMTALAAVCFRDERVDVAVTEVGVGGTFDATNIFRDKAVCVITGVARDHEDFFGPRLEDMLAEDLGIIRTGVPVVAAAYPPRLRVIIEKAAGRAGSPLFFRGSGYKTAAHKTDWRRRRQRFDYSDGVVSLRGLEISLMGGYQIFNAAAAVKAALSSADRFPSITETAVREGLAAATWPGRFDIRKFRGNTVVVDGAHNEDAMRSFVGEYLRSPLARRRTVFVFGAMKDKNYAAMAETIAGAADEVAVCPPPSPRAASAEELAAAFRRRSKKIPCAVMKNAGEMAEFLSKKKSSNIVVCGSLYLAGAALEIMDGAATADGDDTAKAR